MSADTHQHDQGPDDIRTLFTQGYWDEKYAASTRIWSGKPNQRLVEQVGPLTPGTALDVGCGEGADVVWLAQQGWRVTGVDVSGVALERAERHAVEAGVSERAGFHRADVFAGEPLPGTGPGEGYDLVTASFVHVPPDDFDAVYTALADAVAPGGSLVVLAHHPDDNDHALRNPALAALLFAPQAVTRLLPEAEWEVLAADAPTRVQSHEGRDHTVTDTVVRARRRPV